MKWIRKHIKFFLVLCIGSLFFQSCRVYHHDSVPIEDAATSNKRAKIKMQKGRVHKYDRIEQKDDQFFGIKERNKKILEIPLNPEEIKSIRLHNRPWSVIYGIGIGAIGAYAIFLGTVFTLLFVAW